MSSLARPLPLPCGAVLPNRIAKSAMSEDMAGPGNLPGEKLVRLYRRWGAGGAGLLLSGHVMIDRRAMSEPHNVLIEGPDGMDALRAWADAGRAGGSAFWPQINHPGRQITRSQSREPVAPSAVPMRLPGRIFAPPRALTPTEIEDIVARFGRTAGAVKAAGFDGVQIHGAHGYLVSQFLSPLTNVREDAWGGDAERRRRFVLAVIAAVRAEVGPKFPVGIKLNSADFQRGGIEEGESMDTVAAIEAAGIDLLEISGGTYERPAQMGTTSEVKARTAAREAYFLHYAREVRARTRVPLLLTGGFRTRAGMEAALTEGAVDMVGLARPLALEPELPRALIDGTTEGSAVEPRRTGIRQLDAISEIAWYTTQMHRMGKGLDPAPGLWPWTVLLRMAARQLGLA
jgi:2,4-dienoyl-CoA reductase-like NADH-dependent reductase (Old Yellow Enzyme family)